MQQDFERYADEIKDGLKEDGPEFEPFVPFESEERTPLPSFPVDALPSELRNYVSAVAESLQVPVDMPVYGKGAGGADNCLLQQKHIKSVGSKQLIHKLFHRCNL